MMSFVRSSVILRIRPSVNFSYFKLPLENCEMDCDETWQGWRTHDSLKVLFDFLPDPPMGASADPEGGGDRGSGPPQICQSWVLCRGLMGRRGGPTVVFTLSLSFLSDLLCSPVLYIYIILHVHTSKWNFSMEQSSFLYISLIQIIIESNFSSLAFMKRHFYIFLV